MINAAIIIVSYNSKPDLERCLNSVLATTYDAEIIVVDNASTDGSAEFVESKFLMVKVIRLASNLGFAAGNNIGVAQTSRDVVVFLNPDTVVTTQWLENLCGSVQDTSPPCLVSPMILFIDFTPPTIYTCGNHVSYSGLTFCREWGQRVEQVERTEQVSAISGTCFAMYRTAFEALGGFDEDLFMYLEDTDLSWRARLAGMECKVDHNAVIYHQYGLRFSPQKSYYLERNRYILLAKNLSTFTFVSMIPLLIFTEFIVWGYLILSGPIYIRRKLESFQWLFRHRGEILAARQITQAGRLIDDRDILDSFNRRLLFTQTVSPYIANILEQATGPIFDFLGQIPLLIAKLMKDYSPNASFHRYTE